jgi:hypothetical protein
MPFDNSAGTATTAREGLHRRAPPVADMDTMACAGAFPRSARATLSDDDDDFCCGIEAYNSFCSRVLRADQTSVGRADPVARDDQA